MTDAKMLRVLARSLDWLRLEGAELAYKSNRVWNYALYLEENKIPW